MALGPTADSGREAVEGASGEDEGAAGKVPVVLQTEVMLTVEELRMLNAVAARTGQSVSSLIQGAQRTSGTVKTAEAVPSVVVPVGDDDEESPAGDLKEPRGDLEKLPDDLEKLPDDLEKLPDDDGDSPASSRLQGTDSETQAATAPPATVDGPVRSRRLLLPAVAVVAVAVFVVLAVGLLHYRSKAHSSQETAAARTQAVKAASTYAVEVGSYQYQHLKQDFAKISNNSTPSYATSYLRSTTALSKLLVQYKADSTATILDAGVQSATPSRVVVLVYINQRVSNSLSKKLTNSRSLIKFTLVEHKGRWIIDGITDDV